MFALAVCAFCGPYGDLSSELNKAGTAEEKLRILKDAPISDDDLATYVRQARVGDPKSVETATDYVALMAMAEAVADPKDPTDQVKRIKSSVVYKDDGKQEHANWLSGAIERLKNLGREREAPERNSGNAGAPNLEGASAFARFFIMFVWFLLGAAVLAFIIYAARFISFGKLKKRRAKTVLEDDEPERTLDEWLALAEAYEKEGRYREAVRSLYLACLLKFDERNIARFMRGQTNWEHLARIESSPRMPAGLDFRAPTQSFDKIWYGHKVRGMDDVADFKAWYGQVTRALQEAAA